MKDERSILYKKDYVPAAKTDIRKTFARIIKEQKKMAEIQTTKETQPLNIVQYKKYKC